MIRPIPAPGYQLISGKRRPPASWGEKLFTQLRGGWCDPEPWPTQTTVWRWEWIDEHNFKPSAGDVVAVRREHQAREVKDGRQANGAYE